MKICIVGAGNTGVASAIDISQHYDVSVFLYTKRKIEMPLTMLCDEGKKIISKNVSVTSNLEFAVKDAEFIIITYPSFLIEEFLYSIKKFKLQTLVFLPGYGGKEFLVRNILMHKIVMAGFDRSPYVARLKNSSTVVAAKKNV